MKTFVRLAPLVRLVPLAALLLAACAGLPPKSRAVTPVQDDSLGLGATPAAAADAQWWHAFADPQLDKLMETALASNPSLAQAGARLEQARAQVDSAHAGLLPSAALSGGETRAKIPDGFPDAIAGGQTVWIGNLGASLNWDLDLWGRERDALAAARQQVDAAQFDAAGARLMVSGAVAQAWLDLYRSEALADIAQRAAEQRRSILEITQRRVASGIDTRVELREAEAAVPQAEQLVTQANAAQALAVHRLAALAGQGAAGYAAIARAAPDLDAALSVPDELPLNLLARRPDVLAARARVAASDAQRQAARAAFYPTLGLRALAGFASFSLQDLLGASSFGYGAGGSLALPLFDAGRLRASYANSDAALTEAVAHYDGVVLAAVHDAADQLSQIDALGAERGQQERTLAAAEEAWRLAQERYAAGLTNYLVVLNTETLVLDARRQQLALHVAQAQARVALLIALGGDFTPPAQSQSQSQSQFQSRAQAAAQARVAAR